MNTDSQKVAKETKPPEEAREHYRVEPGSDSIRNGIKA
jgi:hypothetical protein